MGSKLVNHHGFLFFFWVCMFLISPLYSQSKILGPVSTVSKHLCFPDFNAYRDRRIQYDLKLLGSAKLAEKEGIIQIPNTETQDLKYQAGRAIYSSPIRLLDPHTRTPASFNTTFSFQIDSSAGNYTPSGAGNRNSGSGGSGLTFIIVPDEVTVGRPGPWLGMLNDACDDDYKTFAVEFDTFRNREFGDPNDNHVGINLGSIVSNSTIDAADAGVSFRDGLVLRAWINYSGNQKMIDLRLGADSDAFPARPLYYAPLDLSTFLSEYMFVGFSASTGNLTQIHNILSWNFSSVSEAFLRVPTEETCETKLFAVGERNPSKRKAPSAFLVFIAVVILCFMVVLNLYCNGKNREKTELDKGVLAVEVKKRPRPPNKPRRFSLTEISRATKCFSEMEMLGGSFRGVLHRGILTNSCCIAVKRFSTQFIQSYNVDRRRTVKRISELSRVRHPNLVPVRGWCYDKRETMVVYDYMPNGSIDKWLFARGVLPWTRRYKLIRDIAEALCFLHSKKLIHKNVKTSNVLLDISFRGLLGDFGLVVEPNFMEPISEKIDVYAFGVMVLEIVAGRRRLDLNLEKEEQDLLGWSWRLHEKVKMVHVVDKKLTVYNVDQVGRAAAIGLMCTMSDAKVRPTMEEVVAYLNLERAMPDLPAARPVALFPSNSTSHLCSLHSCAPLAKLGRFDWRGRSWV